MDKAGLKNTGLKATLPRMKILKLFEENSKRHLSADEIYKKLQEMGEEMAMATLYRVLAQFETAGLIIRHHFENDHAIFELNEGAHHDHLICIQCGRVEEFMDTMIEERQQTIAQTAGFQITDHHLNIYGVCKECQQGETAYLLKNPANAKRLIKAVHDSN